MVSCYLRIWKILMDLWCDYIGVELLAGMICCCFQGLRGGLKGCRVLLCTFLFRWQIVLLVSCLSLFAWLLELEGFIGIYPRLRFCC